MYGFTTITSDLAFSIISFEKSSKTGKAVELESTCAQPAPLPADLIEGLLDD